MTHIPYAVKIFINEAYEEFEKEQEAHKNLIET